MKVQLYDRRKAKLVQAEVRSGLPIDTLQEAQSEWKIAEERFTKTLLEAGLEIPDRRDWDWSQKYRERGAGISEFLAVEADGKIQGMLELATTPVKSRRNGYKADDILYAEYLEAAPWNLKEFAGDRQIYRGVGTAMVAVAIQRSVDLGCWGRIGLHSLQAAEGFYLKAGFIDLGMDQMEGFHYLELPGDE